MWLVGGTVSASLVNGALLQRLPWPEVVALGLIGLVSILLLARIAVGLWDRFYGVRSGHPPLDATAGVPVGWITRESLARLKRGGNASRSTVPIHNRQSHVANKPLYASPPATPLEMELHVRWQLSRKDAERYRWLRHGDNDELVMEVYRESGIQYLPRSERLDAAIDAAMMDKQISQLKSKPCPARPVV